MNSPVCKLFALAMIWNLLGGVFAEDNLAFPTHTIPAYAHASIAALTTHNLAGMTATGFETMTKRANPGGTIISSPELDGNSSLNANSSIPDALEKLRQQIRRRLTDFKAEVELVHAFGPQEIDSEEVVDSAENNSFIHRQPKTKRAVITASSILPGRRRRNITSHFHKGGVDVVSRIYRRQPQPFDSKDLADLKFVKVKSDSYIVSLEKTRKAHTALVIYKIEKGLNPREILRQDSPGGTTFESVQINDQLYVLVVKYKESEKSLDSKELGSHLFHVDFSSSRLTTIQILNTDFARAVLFWVGSGEEANDIFLGIAPEFKNIGKGLVNPTEISLYRWQGAYFDKVSSIPVKNPQALAQTSSFWHGYLAVANYKDEAGSTSAYSEILKYNQKESKYLVVQKILTHGARDIQFFTINAGSRDEHFVAIANSEKTDGDGRSTFHVKSYILKHARERYIPFQSLETYGCYQILPVKQANNQFLLVVGELRGIRIFQYNGWAFTQTYSLRLSEADIPFHSVRLRSFAYESQTFLAIASQAQDVQGGIYSFEFDQKEHNQLSLDVEKWCLAKLVALQAVNMSALEEKVDHAPKLRDEEVILSSQLTFSKGIRAVELFTKKLDYANTLFHKKLSKQLADSEMRLNDLNDATLRLFLKLENVVTRDTNQFISTPIKFGSVQYSGHSLKGGHITTENINGININDLISRAIRLDGNYKFATATIGEVNAGRNLEVRMLNDHSLDSYALKSSPNLQVFTAENKFNSDVLSTQGLQAAGSVDDLDFENVQFLLTQGNQSFTSINVQDSSTNNLNTDSVNGVDVQHYMDEAVTKTGTQTITGEKLFKFINSRNWDASALGGLTMDQIFLNTIKLRAPSQTFTAGRTQMEHVLANSFEITSGVINDIVSINSDLVSIATGSHNFESLEFPAGTFIDDLRVEKSLNDIKVKDGKLDVILKSTPTPQLIANKLLDAIVLAKDSQALGLVDGVKLDGWSPNLELELQENRIRLRRMKIDGVLRAVGGMHTDPARSQFTLNSRSVSDLLLNSLRLDAEKLPDHFRGKIVFESVHVNGDTKMTNTVNGMKTSQWLLRNAEGKVRITADKIFTKDIKLMKSSNARGLFGTTEQFSPNILQGFDDLLIDGTDQTVRRPSKFTELLEIDNLECPSLILNGVRVEDLMLKGTDQELTGKQIFIEGFGVESELQVDGNIDSLRLCGVTFSDAVKNTLRTSGLSPQKISGRVTFENLRAENMNCVNIGDQDANTLLDNIVRRDSAGEVVLMGSLIFGKLARLQGIAYSGTLNDIPQAEWGRSWLTAHGDQTIVTPTTFSKSISADNVKVDSGKVGSFDILQFQKEALRIDRDGHIGTLHGDSVKVENNIDLGPEAKVNGHLLKNILLKNLDQTQVVTGSKIYKGTVAISGDLEVKVLAGFLYNEAARFALGKADKQDNLRVKGNMRFRDEPNFFESFNEEDWSQIVSGIWWLAEDTTISGPIELVSGIHLKNGAHVSGLLNGVDLNKFENEYMSRTKDQILTGTEVTFAKGLTVDSLQVSDITLLNGGKFNGLDIVEFHDSVLWHGDQDIKIRMSFEKLDIGKIMMEQRSLVGGIDLDENAMTLHGENIVTGHFTFDSLHANELSIASGTLLNGINLDDWSNNAAKVNEKGTVIEGPVKLKKALFSEGVRVLGLVNGIEYTRSNIFTLSGDQHVDGLFTFKQDHDYTTGAFLALEGFTVDGLFNGLNLKEAIESLVKDDEGDDQLIVSGVKKFNQALFADSVHSEGLFQENELDLIIKELEARKHILPEEHDFSLEDKYQELLLTANHLSEISSWQAVFLDYFKAMPEIQLNFVNRMQTVNIFQSQYIAITSKSTSDKETLVLKKYNPKENSYMDSAFPPVTITGEARGLDSFARSDGYFMFLTVQNFEHKIASLEGHGIENSVNNEFGREIADSPSRAYLLQIHQPEGDHVVPPYSVIKTLHGDAFGKSVAFKIPATDGSLKDCVATLASNQGQSSATVYCFETSSMKSFHVFQTIPAKNPTLISVILKRQKTLLIIGGNNPDDQSSVVDVWAFTKGDLQFAKEDCIPVLNLLSMDASGGFNNNVFLAVVSGNIKNSLNFGQVYIYRYSNSRNQFVKHQSIAVDDPLEVKFQQLSVSKESVLYILRSSNFNNLYTYTFQGLSGWILKHTLSVESGAALAATTFEIEKNYHAHVFISRLNFVNVLELKFNGNANSIHATANSTTFTSIRTLKSFM